MSVYLGKKHFVRTIQNTFLSPESKGNELKNQAVLYCPHKSCTSVLSVSSENTVCRSVMKFAWNEYFQLEKMYKADEVEETWCMDDKRDEWALLSKACFQHSA